MKNIHDLAKALAPQFGISVREAYYYADFVMNVIHKKIISQEYNAVVLPLLGNIYLSKEAIKRYVAELELRLKKLRSEEHFRNLPAEYRNIRIKKMKAEIKVLTDRFNILQDYRNSQQEFYDYKVKRMLARRILRGETPVPAQNGYASLKGRSIKRIVQSNSPQTKGTPLPMDLPPPDYL